MSEEDICDGCGEPATCTGESGKCCDDCCSHDGAGSEWCQPISNAQPTPSPWFLVGNHEDGIEIIGPRKNCRRNGEKDQWQLAVIDNGVFPDHEAEDWANARLMAAAPDLLAACEALVLAADNEVTYCRSAKSTDLDFRDNVARIQRAQLDAEKLIRAAIAKAKGEGK